MAKSVLDVWNMALGMIGISKQVADVNEQSNEARQCRLYFDNVRDLVLEEADWPFAERYVALQDIGSPPSDWSYRYRYPNDCIKARRLATSDQITTGQRLFLTLEEWTRFYDSPKYPFRVVDDQAGKAIVTDLQNAVLVYTGAVDNLALWPMSALMALAACLATYIANPLAAQKDMAKDASRAYETLISKAIARQFNEGEEKPEPESEFTAARL